MLLTDSSRLVHQVKWIILSLQCFYIYSSYMGVRFETYNARSEIIMGL